MSILSIKDLQDIQSSEDLRQIFIKLGYEDTYGELDIEDLELTETQVLTVYRAFLIGSYEQDALQVILFELKWYENHILRQRLQAIAKNLSQRHTLFIVLGTTDYKTFSLINVDKKFDEKMNLLPVIKETRINLDNLSIFDVRLLESLATKKRQSREIYQAQSQIIQYAIQRTRERDKSKDTINSYLHQIGRIPLLKSEEEIILARQIKHLIKIKEEIELLKKTLSREPTEGEISQSLMLSIEDLKQRIKNGRKAKNKLITANLRLVVSVAKKYVGQGLDLLDLIQEGNFGLVRATEKFDPQVGARFSTYSTWWIKQAITRAIYDQSRLIRIPVHLWDQYNKLRKLIHSDHQGKILSLEEIATQLETTTEKLYSLRKIFLPTISLDALIQDDQESTIGDFIYYTYIHDSQLLDEIFYEQFTSFIRENLRIKEFQVLIYRFGLFRNREFTLEEIGNRFGVTRERIRQIENKAISKIKSRINSDFDLDFSLENKSMNQDNKGKFLQEESVVLIRSPEELYSGSFSSEAQHKS